MYSDAELKDFYLKSEFKDLYLKTNNKGVVIWNKARWYICIIYPEHWENFDAMCNDIKSIGFPCALSPLHNADVTEDGEIKKEHYHLVIYWSGQCTPYKVYTTLCGYLGEDSFFGLEIGGNGNKCVRYFTHIDFPEKAQYNFSEIVSFNGFDVARYYKEGMVSDMDTVREIKKVIKENNVLFFNDLDEILDAEYPDLYQQFISNRNVARHIKDYIKSREYQMVYDGEIEKSMIVEHLPDGRKKQIFNRQIKVVNG